MLTRLDDLLASQAWPSNLRLPATSDLVPGFFTAQTWEVISDLGMQLRVGSVALIGPRNQGKTFMALAAAMSTVSGSSEATAYYVRSRDIERTDITDVRALQDLSMGSELDEQPQQTVIIIDDIHVDPVAARRLVQATIDPSVVALLVGNELSEEFDEALDIPAIHEVRWKSDEEVRLNVVKNFFERTMHRPLPAFDEAKSYISSFGSNLSLITLGLSRWADLGFQGQLSELDSHWLTQRLMRLYQLSPLTNEARHLLLYKLAIVGEFEMAFPVVFLDDGMRAEAVVLKRQGLVEVETKTSMIDGQPISWISLSDDKAASLLRNALSSLGSHKAHSIEKELLPLATSPQFVWAVTTRLASAKRGTELAKLLQLEEVQRCVEDAARVRFGSGRLTWCFHIYEALKPMHRYLCALPLTETLIGDTLEEWRGCTPNRLRKSLNIFRYAIDLNVAFAIWRPEDWQQTARLATLGTLKTLSYSFERWKLSAPLNELVNALTQSPDQLERLFGDDSAELGESGFNGLIGNISRVAPIAAVSLVEMAMRTNGLKRLVSNSRVGDTHWLLRKTSELDPQLGRELLYTLMPELHELVQSSDPSTLYTLCIVTRLDRDSASELLDVAPASINDLWGPYLPMAYSALRDTLKGQPPDASYAAAGGNAPPLPELLTASKDPDVLVLLLSCALGIANTKRAVSNSVEVDYGLAAEGLTTEQLDILRQAFSRSYFYDLAIQVGQSLGIAL